MGDRALAFFAGVYCARVNWSHMPSRACLGGEGGGGRNFLEEGEGSEIFLCGDRELDGSRRLTGGAGSAGSPEVWAKITQRASLDATQIPWRWERQVGMGWEGQRKLVQGLYLHLS